MHETMALVPISPNSLTPYDNSLQVAGQIADQASQYDAFSAYHQSTTTNTRRQQRRTLEAFSSYLARAGIPRSADDLYYDPEAWRGMSYGILRGFVTWSLQQGYSIGTINARLATIRQYCRLAGPPPEGAGVIVEQDLAAILTVKGYAGKVARNIDADRQHNGIPTRIGTKKAEATMITTGQALNLKKTTTRPGTARANDEILAVRDALLMGLLIEHALRCSEVAALNVEHLDLVAGTITVYRQKTDQTDRQRLMTHTMMAAEAYLAQLERRPGPLFTGYQGKRLSTRAINARVKQLGEIIGVEKLSPHDLRHFWAFDALRNGTPIDQVKSGGGWKSDTMVLRYAKRTGIANAGVKISE